MSDSEKIPIVVLNYNDFDTADSFLERFERHLGDILELVFVDNCSTDGSYEKLNKKYGHLGTFLRSDRNAGYGRGNNIGLRYVKEHMNAAKVIISNPDIMVDKKVIEKLSAKLDDYPDVKIIAPAMVNADGSEAVSAWRLPGFFRETFSSLYIVNHLFKLDKDTYSEEELADSVSVVDTVNGSFFMADMKAFDEIGFFCEDTFLYCEENIVAFKMKKAGYSEMLVNDLSYTHIHNATIGKIYSKIVKRYRLLCDSKKVYFKECLNIGCAGMIFFNFISFFGMIERKLGSIHITRGEKDKYDKR